MLILAALMPMVLHELGHFIAAFIFTGEKVVFRFETWKLWIIPVPFGDSLPEWIFIEPKRRYHPCTTH